MLDEGPRTDCFCPLASCGQVKSRLTQLLSSQEAADLYRAFLVDSLAQYASLEVDVRLYMADEGDPGVRLYDAQLKKQCGNGLGSAWNMLSGKRPWRGMSKWL